MIQFTCYSGMQKKLYKTTLYNEAGWVDKPKVSDGLWTCWVFNPTYPLCHFFMHSTISVLPQASAFLAYFFEWV